MFSAGVLVKHPEANTSRPNATGLVGEMQSGDEIVVEGSRISVKYRSCVARRSRRERSLEGLAFAAARRGAAVVNLLALRHRLGALRAPSFVALSERDVG